MTRDNRHMQSLDSLWSFVADKPRGEIVPEFERLAAMLGYSPREIASFLDTPSDEEEAEGE